MKKLLGLVFLMLFLVSATNFTSSEPQKEINQQEPEVNSLEGTWDLVSRYNYDGINVSDTMANLNGYRQVKIYSKGKVMWTRYSPDDPNEWFGYGSYINTKDSLQERLEFGSEAMLKIMDTVQKFKWELIIHENDYSQISVDKNGNRTFSENYVRID